MHSLQYFFPCTHKHILFVCIFFCAAHFILHKILYTYCSATFFFSHLKYILDTSSCLWTCGSFPFSDCKVFHCMNSMLYLVSPLLTHIWWFPMFSVTNSAAVNILVHVSLCTFQDKFLEVELLDQRLRAFSLLIDLSNCPPQTWQSLHAHQRCVSGPFPTPTPPRDTANLSERQADVWRCFHVDFWVRSK